MARISSTVSLQSTSPRLVSTPPRSIGTSPGAVLAEETEGVDSSEHGDFIAILTYSKSPEEDFRRSMKQLMEARLEREGVLDREFVEELLFRYLDSNNDKFYGSIVRAFLDLIAISPKDSGRSPARRRPLIFSGRTRRRMKLEIQRLRSLCSKSI